MYGISTICQLRDSDLRKFNAKEYGLVWEE